MTKLSNEEIAQAALGTLQKWVVLIEVRTRDAFDRKYGSYPNWNETCSQYHHVDALTRFSAEKIAIEAAKKLHWWKGKIVKVRVLRITKEGEFTYDFSEIK